MNFNKTGKVLTSKFVETGPSSYKKKLTGARSHEGWEPLIYSSLIGVILNYLPSVSKVWSFSPYWRYWSRWNISLRFGSPSFPILCMWPLHYALISLTLWKEHIKPITTCADILWKTWLIQVRSVTFSNKFPGLEASQFIGLFGKKGFIWNIFWTRVWIVVDQSLKRFNV
jgi:hypothetical protein